MRTRRSSRLEVQLEPSHLAQQGEGGALPAGGGRPEAPEQFIYQGEVGAPEDNFFSMIEWSDQKVEESEVGWVSPDLKIYKFGDFLSIR